MMVYCPECGSELADLDSFCAYCGINLAQFKKFSQTGEKFELKDEANSIENTSPENEPKVETENGIANEFDGVEDPQDWWTKTEDLSVPASLPNISQPLPTIEKYADEKAETVEETVAETSEVAESKEVAEIETETPSESAEEIPSENIEETSEEIDGKTDDEVSEIVEEKTDEEQVSEATDEVSEEIEKAEEEISGEVEETPKEDEENLVESETEVSNIKEKIAEIEETEPVNEVFQSTVAYSASDFEQLKIEAENEETVENEGVAETVEKTEDKIEEEISEPIEEIETETKTEDVEEIKEEIEVEKPLETEEIIDSATTSEVEPQTEIEDELEAKLNEIHLLKEEIPSEETSDESTVEETEPEEIVAETESEVEDKVEESKEDLVEEVSDESVEEIEPQETEAIEEEIQPKEEVEEVIEETETPKVEVEETEPEIVETTENEEVKSEVEAETPIEEAIEEPVYARTTGDLEETAEVEESAKIEEAEAENDAEIAETESDTKVEESEPEVNEAIHESSEEILETPAETEISETVESNLSESTDEDILETSDEKVGLAEEIPESNEAENEENSLLENLAPVAVATPIVAGAILASQTEETGEEKSVETPQSIENAEVGDDQESRSYTNPINQGSDTGGKKSKLQPLAEGTVLNNRYEIVRKIGGGGMGAVYLASDRNLGGVLRAVKEMVQSYIEEDAQEKAVQDFKRESLLLTSLDHISIPTIYDYFLDQNESRFYLVMKYISGGDLGSRLRSAPEGKIDEKTVTEWAIQVADVLDYLHRHEPPIVYRDLKPSNVMVDGNSGRIMLIDFGIARWVNKEEKGVTAVGTMGYAPPELFSGSVEPRSDIYSLGSTMFHLLTGADPQNNPLLIFDFNKNPRPRQISSQISDQMEQILMRSVEYNVEGRFTSAAEMREILIGHLDAIRTGRLTFGVTQGVSSTPFTGTQLVFCGFCGQKIVGSDMFCPFCGAKQPMAQASTPLPAFDVPKLTAKLLVVSTSELDAPTYNLEKDNNLIGRRDPMSNIFPEVDLSKYDPQTKISRRHARVWREADTFMIEDLGSSNGTILISSSNQTNKLLPHTPKVLTHGDKLKLGDTVLHFVVG